MGVRRDYGCPEEGGSKVAEDTPWLNKGAREIGMTRKGHEKNHPARMQGSGGVLCGEGVLFTPMTEVGDETVGPECVVKTEKVAPVCITTCSITLGSERVMEVTENGSNQSSSRPWSSKAKRVRGACAVESGPS